MKLFGFEISKKIDKRSSESGGLEIDNTIKSFAIPSQNDGTMLLPSSSAAGYYGQILDIDGTSFVNEKDLILKYRAAAGQPECDTAIADITNAAIISDSKGSPVKLDLDVVDLPQKVKERIFEEFNIILQLLDFNFTGYDIFRRWYIDGKVYFHLQIDSSKPKDGIKGIVQIDPLKIKKIKEISTTIDRVSGIKSNKITAEYFLYSDDFSSSTTGVKIDPNAIVYVPSGILDESGKISISYLHKSIKLVNQLQKMEDSLVIYRVARAPERRIFYIDVGNLPKGKAEEYVQGLMAKYRNKLVYDACLDMNTLIPLLDGRTLSLRDIQTAFENGERLWAYSCDPNTGKFVPGLITSAGVTKFNQDVIRLTLDNGKTITCTHDHKFPVWNKGKVEAKDLIIGDSMIPFYTREEKIVSKHSGYHQHFDNSDKKWIFTHRAVSIWKDKNLLDNEWVYDTSVVMEQKGTIHHKNYNRYDNSPENLVKMNSKDHFKYHKQHNGLAGKIGGKVTADRIRAKGDKFFPNLDPIKMRLIHAECGKIAGRFAVENKIGIHGLSHEEICDNAKLGSDALLAKFADPAFYASICAIQKASWNNRDDRRLAAAERGKTLSMEHFQNMSVLGNGSRWGSNKSEENRKALSESQQIMYPKNISSIIEDAVRTNKSVSDILIHINAHIDHNEWTHLNDKKIIKLRKSISPFTHKDLRRLCKTASFNTIKEYKEALLYKNHKIINIEYLDKKIDVGTLGIDKDEIYHNYHTFALDAGIYTCNSTGDIRDDRKSMSILEDFFLPRRDGCISLDTKIKILDGRDTPLIDLIQDYNSGIQNWVYSVSPDGTIVPGKISWAGITRRNTEVVKVYLDNGEVVTTTPDHKFILRNGEKVEAKELVVGSSLATYNTEDTNNLHIVETIEFVPNKIDVGTLTIDEHHEHHDYHNFALSSGIFVMNSKGTEITTLPGGENLSEIADINFFQKKLYRSLNVPSARLEADSLFVSGRSSEISREEVKFQKFISRLRKKFSIMFSDMLRVQCILKGIITLKDWPAIRECMGVDFIEDNFYSELKDSEILRNRLEVLELIQPSIGIYYSNKWIRSNVLNMSEHDVIRMQEEMDEEKAAEEKTPTEEEPSSEEEKSVPEEEPEAEVPASEEEEPSPEGEEEKPGKEWSINMNKRT